MATDLAQGMEYLHAKHVSVASHASEDTHTHTHIHMHTQTRMP
jgi:hypothetical protein